MTVTSAMAKQRIIAGIEFLKRAPISPTDRDRMFRGNAEALLKV
jgi:hypothetical protein